MEAARPDAARSVDIDVDGVNRDLDIVRPRNRVWRRHARDLGIHAFVLNGLANIDSNVNNGRPVDALAGETRAEDDDLGATGKRAVLRRDVADDRRVRDLRLREDGTREHCKRRQ